MPRIPDEVLDCTIFLYRSVAAAKAGEQLGGSGFLVGVMSEAHPEFGYYYAVTASHVIREGQAPVVRLNTQAGDFDVLPITQDDWIHHPDADDVAILPLNIPPHKYRLKAIGTNLFLSHNIIEEAKIGPGDDVFMVGRFINHEGTQRNLATTRFGTIALMPGEPIRHMTRGINQESFLIEMHSIPGYSGSPVFMQFLKGTPRYGFEGVATGTFGPYLVGIDWCHLNDYAPVVYQADTDSQVEDYVVKSNLGMAGVLPAWKILDLLNLEEEMKRRREGDKQISKLKGKGGASLDVATAPFTRDDFQQVLEKVSRKRTSSSKPARSSRQT